MPRCDLLQSFDQRLLRRCIDVWAGAVDVSDASIAFRQFDVAADLAGNTDESIDKAAFGEQGFERL
ncbi:hypothetical protein D3C80_1705680 [compost metagenome]